jgi:NADPH2 dehydrogenase
MKHAPINRFTPLQLPHNKNLKNRVVIPPMASQTADTMGYASTNTVNHYARLAKANSGLIMVEYTYVDPTGRSEPLQLGIFSDHHIEGLSKVATAIKDSGALSGIQLTHSGAKTERPLSGGVLMGPSAIAVPVKDRHLERPAAMTMQEIGLWKSTFSAAAGRAVKAGFELIEIHAAHGYGLNQWLSPITNQRSDHFGQTLAGRMQLLLDIVNSIRTNHADLLISVRIPGQDFIKGGITTAESTEIAKVLERAGVDILNISSGIGGWQRPSVRAGEGYLVEEARIIQSAVSAPVIGVGGIESGAYIDRGLKENWFQLAAVGRAILRDPIQWQAQNL